MTRSIEQIERRRALALLAPATLWTVLFFALPFGVMAALSLRRSGTDGWSLGNYHTTRQLFFWVEVIGEKDSCGGLDLAKGTVP